MALVPYVQAPVPLTGDVPNLAAAMERELRRISANLADVTSGINVPYPLTAAETTALVTPVDYSYPELYVDRYVTNVTPGTTDTSPGFNAAFKVALVKGGAIVYGATAPYATTSPINFTQAAAPNVGGITLRCDAPVLESGLPMSIVGNHTGHVFDCTGTAALHFKDVSIGSGASIPKTAIFQARNNFTNPSGPSVGNSRFEQCYVVGSFSVAAYYNFGAEDDEIIGGYWTNTNTGATALLLYTGNNIKSQSSSFVTVNTNTQSCIDHKIIGGAFAQFSTNAAADAIYLEAIANLKIFAPWVYCSGRAHIYEDSTNAASSLVEIYAFQGEVGSGGLYGIYFGATVPASPPTGWTIDGCVLPNATFPIAAAAARVLDNFHIRNLSEVSTNHGISVPGTLQNSVLHVSGNVLTLGVSKQNLLVGNSAAWTITTRTNDYWVDIGLANKSWTPALGTVTHGGVLTINETHCLFNGNQVDVEFLMTDTVSITATAAQTITGLPAAAVGRSAMVLVANETTGIAIGAGFIEAGTTTIKMPAFTVGAGVSVCVSARYFVA